MRTLKSEYFYATSNRWCSISGENNLHKIIYMRKDYFFDGYLLTDEQGYILLNYDLTNRNIKNNNEYKLLSIVKTDNYVNYLGENVETGELLTFNEEQIKFKK